MFIALPVLVVALGCGLRGLAFRYGDRDPVWWAASAAGVVAAALILAGDAAHWTAHHKGSAYADAFILLLVGAAALFLAARDWTSYGALKSGRPEQAAWPAARTPKA